MRHLYRKASGKYPLRDNVLQIVYVWLVFGFTFWGFRDRSSLVLRFHRESEQ